MLGAAPDLRALERAVAGRYSLERELGRGGMGVVLLARDRSLDRLVALKLLPPMLATQPVLRERFLREARTAAGLSHPNIVPIHAVEEHDDVVFIAMGFVDGETLADRVRRAGPLPPREVTRITREVAWALAYAHGRGVVHRDVKPDNILMERGSGRALVTDFGIARVRDGVGAVERLTLEGQVIGTAAFMSPEQGAGEPVDGRSDLYALGGVGFYALTGRAPFDATSLEALLVARFTRAAPPVASVRPDVPPALAVVIDRCLAREPHDRFASGEAVAEALSDASGLASIPDVAPPVRSFLRAAEQSVLLTFLIFFFTFFYGLPATRRVVPLVVGVVLGGLVLAVDLARRARELVDEGFGAGDVRRGFEMERQAHAEEMRQLFDARRTAMRRRTRRRAWTAFGVGVALRVLIQLAFNRHIGGWNLAPGIYFVMATLDIANAVSLVVLLNTTRHSERRAFRVAAWLWSSRFAALFFRLAAFGKTRERTGTRAVEAGAFSTRVADLAPETVSRYPELPSLLQRLERTQTTMRVREADLVRALAEAGGDRGAPARPVGDAVPASSGARAGGGPSEHELDERRIELLAGMREALSHLRARRTMMSAALENARIQLLRIGAGVGSPDDMRQEVDVLRALVAESDGESTAAPA